MTTKTLRFGILSTAHIARSFALGIRPSSRVSVAAVASRDGARAQAFADELNIPKAYNSYAQLLADPEVDAIYNPLPNSLHAEWSIQAVRAGKHVLCEKPLAVSAEQAQQMFAEAQRAGVKLVEAYPYLAQPQMHRLMELVDGDAIGKIQSIHAAFGFTMNDESNIRLDASLGGGALYDAGVYPLSLVRRVVGEPPTRVHAMAQWHPRGVDRSVVASLEHRTGILAQISCSFDTSVHRHATLAGSRGMIHTGYSNHPSPDRAADFRIKRGIGGDVLEETVEAPALNGFRAEAESFHALIQGGSEQWSGATPTESVDILRTVEAILRSARSGLAVDMGN